MGLPEKFRPLLGEDADDITKLQYPVLVSPKLDGIRCIVTPEGLISRTRKLIPNRHCQKLFTHSEINFMDGEIIAGPLTAPNVFNRTTSAVMGADSVDDISFNIFDRVDTPDIRFSERLTFVENVLSKWGNGLPIRSVGHVYANTPAELEKIEEAWVSEGYEGVMLRSPAGGYKYGRSTLRQGILLKLKRFVDSEATIVGFTELLHNKNVAVVDALGLSKRSHKREGMVASGILGNLVVTDVTSGVEFEVGTGFTYDQRVELWKIKETLAGKIIAYKYQKYGMVDKPRIPVFKGFRLD